METISQNTRESARVDFFEPVRILVGEEQRLCVFGLDLSADGMRLRSNQPLKRGSKITLEFKTPRGPVRVDEAEVIWSEPFQAINVDGTVPGFGVKFVSVDESARELLAGHIAESDGSGPKRFGAKAATSAAVARSAPGSGPPADADESPDAAAAEGGDESPKVVVQPDLLADEAGKPELPVVTGFDIDPSAEALPIAAMDEPWPPRHKAGHDINRVASLASKVLAGLLVLAGVVGLVMAIRGSDTESDRLLAATPSEATPSEALPKVSAPVVSAPVVSTAPAPTPAAKPAPGKIEPKVATPAKAVPAKPLLATYLPGGMEVKTATDAWTLTIRGAASIKAKTFALNQPARFVVDVLNPSYRGKAFNVNPGLKGVGSVRVRTGQGFTRYVVDFAGGKVPESTVTRNGERLTIRFQNPSDVSKLAAR